MARIVKICNNFDVVMSPAKSTSSNSFICFCLDIIKINPIEEKLPFEIFFLTGQRTTNLGIDIAEGHRLRILKTFQEEYPEYHCYRIAFHSNLSLKYKKLEFENHDYFLHPSKFYVSTNKMKKNIDTVGGEEVLFFKNISKSIYYKYLISISENKYLTKIEELLEVIGSNYHPKNININDPNLFISLQNEEIEHVYGYNDIVSKYIFTKFKPKSINDLSIVHAILQPNNRQYIEELMSNNRIIKQPEGFNDLIFYNVLRETKGILLFCESILFLFQRMLNTSLEEAEQIRRICKEDKKYRIFAKKFLETKNEEMIFDNSSMIEFIRFCSKRHLFVKPKGQYIADSIISCWGVYYKLYFFLEFVQVFCKEEIEEMNRERE